MFGSLTSSRDQAFIESLIPEVEHNVQGQRVQSETELDGEGEGEGDRPGDK